MRECVKFELKEQDKSGFFMHLNCTTELKTYIKLTVNKSNYKPHISNLFRFDNSNGTIDFVHEINSAGRGRHFNKTATKNSITFLFIY